MQMQQHFSRPTKRLVQQALGGWRRGFSEAAEREATPVQHESSNGTQHHTTSLSSNRAVIRIEGDQGPQFLQGMVSNDVHAIGDPGSSPIYTAMQNPKGKLLHDPILYLERGGSPLSILMEVDVNGKQHALQWLTRYKLRRPISVTDVSEQFSVWVAFGPGAPSTPIPEPQAVGGAWHLDPRLPGLLGLRTLLPAGHKPGSGLQGAAPSAEAAYRAWRYMHGVPEGEAEMPADKSEPLLFNLDALHGVSFSKGCYIGQEKNSFTHYRGVIRRRCMPFKVLIEETGIPRADEDVVVEGSGERVGTIRGTAVGGFGLVSIKLKPALQAEVGERALVCKDSGARIQTYRPQWWPPEWGREEEEGAAPASS
ncbi:hypothetical protein DUNSADRAFT_3811 [Dunaliella salina]|uniref:CAF17 C-terminal domain-containing protein n=1 Tax=Dunaliella salina TaxID=3046 RepID=A0ABQ7GTA7_DUNSA|nr:hypothetical protein DUNSADRAFT_3811 [Dunaliella salina]|eukprot:KAF5837848.1 hypothetical protein DUNSADRAFT_3811 [Dunaliella salina]